MTLDEAIKHAEKVAEEKEAQAWEAQLQEEYRTIKTCKECAKEHRQLAEWLKDYKRLKEEEPFINLPCVSSGVCEHDKQKALDKIRAEIEKQEKWLLQAGYNAYNVDIAFSLIKSVLAESEVEG